MVRKYWLRLQNRLVIVALFALLLPALGFAQSLFQAGLEYDVKGKPVAIIISGRNNETEELYVGLSIYPKGITDPLVQGIHHNETIEPGQSFTKKYQLKDADNKEFMNGTFETSLWGKKILRKDAVDPNYYFCKLWGFCFDQQKSYLSGSIFPMK